MKILLANEMVYFDRIQLIKSALNKIVAFEYIDCIIGPNSMNQSNQKLIFFQYKFLVLEYNHQSVNLLIIQWTTNRIENHY